MCFATERWTHKIFRKNDVYAIDFFIIFGLKSEARRLKKAESRILMRENEMLSFTRWRHFVYNDNDSEDNSCMDVVFNSPGGGVPLGRSP